MRCTGTQFFPRTALVLPTTSNGQRIELKAHSCLEAARDPGGADRTRRRFSWTRRLIARSSPAGRASWIALSSWSFIATVTLFPASCSNGVGVRPMASNGLHAWSIWMPTTFSARAGSSNHSWSPRCSPGRTGPGRDLRSLRLLAVGRPRRGRGWPAEQEQPATLTHTFSRWPRSLDFSWAGIRRPGVQKIAGR